MSELDAKYEKLIAYIKALGKAAVAFSGGVDSTLLLKVMHDVLGDNAVAVTVKSSAFPEAEHNEAADFCSSLGIRHIICPLDIFSIDGFEDNPVNRCYLCKKRMFTDMIRAAADIGIDTICEGSNTDDNSDYRPGHRAIDELGVLSPLRYAGLDKADVRALSRRLGLPTADKPSFACLATRLEYGEKITPERLDMIDRSEQLLKKLGYSQARVRLHGGVARIEVERSQIERLLSDGEHIYAALREHGFDYVAMDLLGYRTGSMNELLKGKEYEKRA